MKREEFRALLEKDPFEAFELLFTRAVEEWMEEGPAEVVRILALWAGRARYEGNKSWPTIEFPSVEAILEYAENKRLVEEESDDV